MIPAIIACVTASAKSTSRSSEGCRRGKQPKTPAWPDPVSRVQVTFFHETNTSTPCNFDTQSWHRKCLETKTKRKSFYQPSRPVTTIKYLERALCRVSLSHPWFPIDIHMVLHRYIPSEYTCVTAMSPRARKRLTKAFQTQRISGFMRSKNNFWCREG